MSMKIKKINFFYLKILFFINLFFNLSIFGFSFIFFRNPKKLQLSVMQSTKDAIWKPEETDEGPGLPPNTYQLWDFEEIKAATGLHDRIIDIIEAMGSRCKNFTIATIICRQKTLTQILHTVNRAQKCVLCQTVVRLLLLTIKAAVIPRGCVANAVCAGFVNRYSGIMYVPVPMHAGCLVLSKNRHPRPSL